MPETERQVARNFSFDAMGALGTGLFNALVVNFLAIIARREGGDPLLLAALAAGPFAANTLAIFTGFWVPAARHRVGYVSLFIMLGRALFLGGLLTTGPMALLWMGLGMWLTMAIVAPLQVDAWRGAYPQRLRARVLGYLRVLQTLAGAIAAPLSGLLIERLGQGPMLAMGATLGMLGAAGYSRVRGRPVAASKRFTPVASLRLLAEEPAYGRLIAAWVVWGFGSFMATPLYALVLVDRFQASYADIGWLQLAGAVSGLLAYLILGQYLDRKTGLGVTPLGFLLAGVVPLLFLFAPSLPFLFFGYVLLGVGSSANDLGWQVAMVSRVADEHRLRYQAAHTSITGLRGVAAPFVGSLIISMGFGIGSVLVLGAALGVLGAVLMARALEVDLVDLFGAIFGYGRRPRRDVVLRHWVVVERARIEVAPPFGVDQVLLARQQRATAEASGRHGSAERRLETPQQLAHDPAWHTLALAGVDEAEEHQVGQQHAPVRAEAA
jgi:Major Facilitator Superfamily